MTADLPVSRETQACLDIYVSELRRWQPALNLVSAATLCDVWRRHVLDSLQLLPLGGGAKSWLDLGSGAGLPGLIVAAGDPDARVTLIESDSRKCAFLRSTALRMNVSVDVIEERVEAALRIRDLKPNIVTARALAPLPVLLAYAQPILLNGATGLFPKGRMFAEELTAAAESWTFEAEVIPSRTDPEGRILRITSFAGARTGTSKP